MSSEVKAVRVDDFSQMTFPGAFKYSGTGDRHLTFVCPCGCGQIAGLSLKPENPNGWDFDGNRDHPTAKPSIQILSGCKWHGYLTAGVFKEC